MGEVVTANVQQDGEHDREDDPLLDPDDDDNNGGDCGDPELVTLEPPDISQTTDVDERLRCRRRMAGLRLDGRLQGRT
jgi:hypothetical protein